MSRANRQTILEAQKRLYEQGNLTWKMSLTQKKVYDFIMSCKERLIAINYSRRSGKTHNFALTASQICLKKKRALCAFLQPVKKQCRESLEPIMFKIFENAPPSVRPKYNNQKSAYIFPNGSEIRLFGTDKNNHEKMRGSDYDFIVVDEAGFVECSLEYLLTSVLMPCTLLTKGKIVLSSTTPREPDHDFNIYLKSCQSRGAAMIKTIFDVLADCDKTREQYEKNGEQVPDGSYNLTHDDVEQQINAYPGGVKNENFMREYLCEQCFSSSNQIFPEFYGNKDQIITEWYSPSYRTRYVAMDIGVRDLTAVIFGYADFDRGVIVIENELAVDMSQPGETTRTLAEKIKAIEKELWTEDGQFIAPSIRVSDNNLVMINDLQRDYRITFLPAQKDNKVAGINAVRTLIENKQLIINPRCKQLIHHMSNGVWDKDKVKFKRHPDGHHYDFCDAINYFIRIADLTKNPYPKDYRRSLVARKGDYFNAPQYAPKNRNDFAEYLTELRKFRSSIPKSQESMKGQKNWQKKRYF